MAKSKLDLQEQELLEAYESGELESDLDADRRDYLTKAAEETFKKDKRINIRISSVSDHSRASGLSGRHPT